MLLVGVFIDLIAIKNIANLQLFTSRNSSPLLDWQG
jgi:hypothetical protein